MQTAEYGRAVTVASRAWQTAEQIDQFVEVRLARQRRLTDTAAPRTLGGPGRRGSTPASWTRAAHTQVCSVRI
ncbi:Scr1 family TA system antitoxin-like transcriptional regulator [Streptomyces canus]|uniref:Scr1 family TA system antitoxin-like transcriptional regulator n=1 Tax=Streptomyces canus TaxID=58343 RepID=UPI0027D8BAF5|nr:Scr1 family TA system antitoxin-like transcriptional regulator [Streptomyces canus]